MRELQIPVVKFGNSFCSVWSIPVCISAHY